MCVVVCGLAAAFAVFLFLSRKPHDPGPLTIRPGGPVLYGTLTLVEPGAVRRVVLRGRNGDFGDDEHGEHDDIWLYVEVADGRRLQLDSSVYFDSGSWAGATAAAERLAARLQVPLVVDYQ